MSSGCSSPRWSSPLPSTLLRRLLQKKALQPTAERSTPKLELRSAPRLDTEDLSGPVKFLVAIYRDKDHPSDADALGLLRIWGDTSEKMKNTTRFVETLAQGSPAAAACLGDTLTLLKAPNAMRDQLARHMLQNEPTAFWTRVAETIDFVRELPSSTEATDAMFARFGYATLAERTAAVERAASLFREAMTAALADVRRCQAR